MSGGIDNLRRAGRKASVAPPPDVTTLNEPVTQPAQQQTHQSPPLAETDSPVAAQPSPRKRRTKAEASDKPPGKKLGDLYYLRIQLSAAGRSHLETLKAASDNTSFGEQAIGALRRHATNIKAEASDATPSTDDLIPTRRRTKRLVGAGPKSTTSIGLTKEEALAVANLHKDTSFSYSLLFDLALTQDATNGT